LTVKEGFKNMAVRRVNAERHLVEMLMAFGKIDEPTAEKVAAFYLKNKLAKLDAVNGVSRIKHGAYYNETAIRNAVKIVNNS